MNSSIVLGCARPPCCNCLRFVFRWQGMHCRAEPELKKEYGRPDARRLARGLRAPSAHGSRLLSTARVSERRCNHADHRSTRTTMEALTHMTSSKGAPLQSGVGALSLSA